MTDIRGQWLAMLARLIAPTDVVKAFEALEHFEPFLADLPDAAFTTASLEAVAMTPRRLWLPELREVKEPLQAWWRANRPARVALPAPTFSPEPERAPPTDEERAAVAKAVRDCIDQLPGALPQQRSVAQQRAALGEGREGGNVLPMRTGRHATPEQIAQARADLARKARGEQ